MKPLVIVLALLAPLPACASTHSADASNVELVIREARRGDVIQLSGDLPPVMARDKRGLTIKCDKGAVINGWYWTGGSNLSFDGCIFRPAGGFPGLRFDGVEGLEVRNSRFEGAGLKIVGGRDVTIERSTILRASAGVSGTHVVGLKVLHNAFRLSTSDGVQCAGCTDVEISFNSFDGTERPGTEHPDLVQFWSFEGVVTKGVRITDNVAIGNSQGFNSYDPSKGGIEDVYIARNKTWLTFKWAVAMQNGRNIVLEDNEFNSMPSGNYSPPAIDSQFGTVVIFKGRNMINGKPIPPTTR